MFSADTIYALKQEVVLLESKLEIAEFTLKQFAKSEDEAVAELGAATLDLIANVHSKGRKKK